MNRGAELLRVLFLCSGAGRVNRGIESFFREAFHGLKHTAGLKLRLLKGAGPEASDEQLCWCLKRDSALARSLGAVTRRNGYVIEQWSSLPCVAAQIHQFHPHVVFYSDANLGFLLFWLRRWMGMPYRLLFSNGGPAHPPFVRTDFVHQVAPTYYWEALDSGEHSAKHFMVPYGIRLVEPPLVWGKQERNALRQKLGLPIDVAIVLSVGWVRSNHKRMDYVIQEIAHLPQPRPYLQLVGLIDEASKPIVSLGTQLLGQNGFCARSVPYEEVYDYYRAADCFVLGSIQEGFGRVYLEALMHGLPVIAHEGPVSRYVLGSHAILGDLLRPGALSGLLVKELRKPPDPVLMHSRWASVRDRFSWPVLAESYRHMFQTCSGRHYQNNASACLTRKVPEKVNGPTSAERQIQGDND